MMCLIKWNLVPIVPISTDRFFYQYRATIGRSTDVPIIYLIKKKKVIIITYRKGGNARARACVSAYNNTTKQQKQIYLHDAKN